MPKRNKFSFPVTTLAGSRSNNLAAICKQHHVEGKYKGKLALTTVASGFFEAFSSYEHFVSKKKISSLKLEEPPVFIIGFWRSGTTLLHNLLCQDPNAAYTTTFHTVFPNLLLTQSKWLKPLANWIGPSKRPFDNVDMDMDFPQEEEFGLMNLQPHSIYKFFLFPAEFDQIVKEELFTDKLPIKAIKTWQKHYKEMAAKALINTGGIRYISKNPCNIVRIKLLKQMYPGAKFIFIYRNPYKVVESLYRFISSVFPGVQLQDIPKDFNRKKVTLLYDMIMRHYMEERKSLNESELIEIRMEDFITDIKGNLRNIYKQFQLGDFTSIEDKIDDYLIHHQRLQNGAYEVKQETIDIVNNNFLDIVETLGYQKVNSKDDLKRKRQP